MLISRKSFYFSFIIMMSCVFCANSAFSSDLPRNNIMINTTGALFGNYGPEYERALGNHFGLGLRANVIPSWEAKGGNTGAAGDDYDWIYSVSGYGGGFSARFYPFGQAPYGFYFGPRCDYIAFSGTYEDRAHNEDPVDSSLTLATAHLEVGFKFNIANRIVLGVFGDGGYVAANAPDNSEVVGLLYIIGGGFYVGVAF